MRSDILSMGFALTLAAMLLGAARADAQTEKVLFDFSGQDGFHPYTGAISDPAGNLYGTTGAGGTYRLGTVFELISEAGGKWKETALFNFNGTDGSGPQGLVLDKAGNLYGATSGSVFKLSRAAGGGWVETILRKVSGNSPGSLVFDTRGNLYGTTTQGGTYGDGTVFELVHSPNGTWAERILHNFNNDGTDGWWPFAGLTIDTAGNLYGTTIQGGSSCPSPGCGVVFELTPSGGGTWTESILHNFVADGVDGTSPDAKVVFDIFGNLYGTTSGGGSSISCGVPGCGTVFELTPSGGGEWEESILYTFGTNPDDGEAPEAGLIFDSSGNAYGTTGVGGEYDCGVVFELTPVAGGGWTEIILHAFDYNVHNGNDDTDGANPTAGLIFDASGNLYGTTGYGGKWGTGGDGIVFEIEMGSLPLGRN